MKRVISLILILFLTGCTTDLGTISIQTNDKVSVCTDSCQSDTTTIGTWNVQIFGKHKIENETIKKNIEDIISQFDLLAFQEIRDESETAFPLMMSDLPKYSYIISPRLGRSNIKEQYAFIYNPEKFKFIKSEVWYDSNDNFEREPFIAEFENNKNEKIVFIQIHTKPDDATQEIKSLHMVKDNVELIYNTSNIIILGDLNGDCNYYQGDILIDTGMLVDEFQNTDTTVHDTDCAYDRILTNYLSTKPKIIIPLTNLEVSDHKPIGLVI